MPRLRAIRPVRTEVGSHLEAAGVDAASVVAVALLTTEECSVLHADIRGCCPKAQSLSILPVRVK